MWLAAALCVVLGAPLTPITPDSVAQVLDPVFARCADDGTPGASVSVVYDGAVIFTKGYGVADVATRVPVDPQQHLFRAASVSKLITATAVMQLVEQGKVDLDTDVNTYLPKPIVPEAFGAPITLRNLLQHAAGLDDEFLGMARATPAGLPTLGEYLATGLPKRVFPPDQFCSYSNHGVALAGLVVEAVSGMHFAQYAREKIFAPLGMTHSYFDLVPDANTSLARGYWRGLFGGPLKPAGYDYPLTIPASSLATTAPDMARFMLAHLGTGEVDGQRVLSFTSLETMHAPRPVGPTGVAIGFFERWINGRRCLTHTGLIWGYATQLLLYPEEKLGIYVTLNSEDGDLYDRASGALMDAYFPAPGPLPDAPLFPQPTATLWTLGADDPAWAARRDAACGLYRYTRYTRHSFLKFGLLVAGRASEIEITPGPEPHVLVQTHRGTGAKTTWHEWPEGGFRTTVFRGDPLMDLTSGPGAKFLPGPDGNAAFFVNRSNSYERIAWWESTHLLLLGVAEGYALLFTWLLQRAVPRWRKRIAGVPVWLRRAADIQALTLFAFAVGIGIVLSTLNPFAVAYGPPMAMYPLLCLPLLALVATMAMFVGTLRAVLAGQGTLRTRLQLALSVIGGAAVLAIMNYWNLLGFHFG